MRTSQGYSSRAIPTAYNGVQFRSRLEARWAAFFDLAGWSGRWEYEPFDLNGWCPDFTIRCARGLPIVIEVKPIVWPDDPWSDPHVNEIAGKIVETGWPGEAIILGTAPIINSATSAFGCPILGAFIDRDWHEEWAPYYDKCFAAMGWTDSSQRMADLFSDVSSYRYRITDVHDGDHHLREIDPDCVTAWWRESGNIVQWKAPRSEG